MADDISYVSLFLVFITVLSASLIGGCITLYISYKYDQAKRHSMKDNAYHTSTDETNNSHPNQETSQTNNINERNNASYCNTASIVSPTVNITTPQLNYNTLSPDPNVFQFTSSPQRLHTPITYTEPDPIYNSLPLPPTPTNSDPPTPTHYRQRESKEPLNESSQRKATFDRLHEEILRFPDQSGSRVTEQFDHLDDRDSPLSLSTPSVSDSNAHHAKEGVIIVCYKLPIKCTYNTNTSSWDIQWDDLRNILSNFRMLGSRGSDYNVSFVGWPGVSSSLTLSQQEELEDTLYHDSSHRCYPIFVTETQINDCYKVFCRSILWPLFHYKMPASSSAGDCFGINYEQYWQSYVGLNNLYAKKACVAATDHSDSTGDAAMIWFHNYHLFLAPHFVRRTIPLAQIGLFVHTTFPTSEVFRSLPTCKEILRGILSSDLVGFHTYDYCRHFLSSCKRILDLDAHTLPEDGTLAVHYLGRDVCLRIGHASILSRSIHLMGGSQAVMDARNTFGFVRNNTKNKKIILGIGELDEVRGTMLTIQAFGHFLLSYPTWRDSVHFVMCVSPSTLDDYNDEYVNTLRAPIEKEMKKMNTQYAHDSPCMMNLINMDSLSYPQLLALYTECDVAVFGTFWDGFNTIPYELTAAQQSNDSNTPPPALILSEYMGCMRSLCGVFRINPWKISHVASTVYSALCMTSRERCVAHNARFTHVMSYSIVDWAKGFMLDLRKAAKNETNKRVLPIGFGSNLRFIYIRKDLRNLRRECAFTKLMTAFKTCKYRILLLDYGGTLTADVDHDHDTISPKIIRNLIQLCSTNHQNTIVCIISGQTRPILERAFAECRSTNLLICAEKGAYWKFANSKSNEWIRNDKLMNDKDMASWQTIVHRVLRTYTERTNGSYIQKKSTALVWHYKGCDPLFGDMQANEAERYLNRIIDHKKHYKLVVQRYDHGRALEVLQEAIHKGSASLNIIYQMMHKKKIDDQIFILAVGNDRSDEKMFEAVELVDKNIDACQSFTVKIGIAPTQARYYLNDQSEIIWLLNALSAAIISPISIPPMQPLVGAKARRSVCENDNNPQPFQCNGSLFDNASVRSQSYKSLSQLAKINTMQNQY